MTLNLFFPVTPKGIHTSSVHDFQSLDWALGCLGLRAVSSLSVCPSAEIRRWTGPAPKTGGLPPVSRGPCCGARSCLELGPPCMSQL